MRLSGDVLKLVFSAVLLLVILSQISLLAVLYYFILYYFILSLLITSLSFLASKMDQAKRELDPRTQVGLDMFGPEIAALMILISPVLLIAMIARREK